MCFRADGVFREYGRTRKKLGADKYGVSSISSERG